MNFNNLKSAFLILACSVIQTISLGQSAPNLGTASGFALFTAAGAFNNISAATTVTGNVGTDVGAFNAFPPGTLVGQIHVADPASAQAATDVNVAYSNLSALTCGTVLGTTLGNNQVLGPDVYCLGAASVLNGNLILDGQGDAGSLFFFKINGALSTSTFSTITLINSASLCNVYWQVNGQFTLGDSSVFRGTLLANGAISLLDGAALYGKALSTSGAISLQNNIVAIGMQPVVSIIPAGNTIFCAGDSVLLNSSITNAVGPFSYSWIQGGQTTNSSVTVSPTVTTTYVLEATAINGCAVARDSVLVTVNSPLTIDLGNDTTVTFCTGYLTLDAGVSGLVYSWNTGQVTQTINVSSTGTYYLQASNSNGCIDSDTINVVVNGFISFYLGADTSVCGCILLNAYISGGTYYQWCNGSTYTMQNACTTGMYCVTVGNGICVATDTIFITVNQLPVVNFGNDTTVADSILLNAGNAGSSFLWSNGDTTQAITITSSGQYYVTVTTANGCSASDTFNVSVLAGIAENINEGFHPNIYPNPGNGNFTLSFDTEERGNVEIKIMNAIGLVVYSEKLENFKGVYHKKISLENSAAGIYIADIVRGNIRKTIKVSLE
ncbi:MAG: DUF3494 domain-containing protein [Bacteroidia bacterium]|nr:DUF3494 domain-containing protein [Bacteroidia bacterium]